MIIFISTAVWLILWLNGAPEWAAVGTSIIVCFLLETRQQPTETPTEQPPIVSKGWAEVPYKPEKPVELRHWEPWVGPEAEQYKEFKEELDRASK